MKPSITNPFAPDVYPEPEVHKLIDLFVKDEEPGAAFDQIDEDMEYMMSRVNKLDESHPAYKRLEEQMRRNLPDWMPEEMRSAVGFQQYANRLSRDYLTVLRGVRDANYDANSIVPPGAMAGIFTLGALGVTAAMPGLGLIAAGAAGVTGAALMGERLEDLTVSVRYTSQLIT